MRRRRIKRPPPPQFDLFGPGRAPSYRIGFIIQEVETGRYASRPNASQWVNLSSDAHVFAYGDGQYGKWFESNLFMEVYHLPDKWEGWDPPEYTGNTILRRIEVWKSVPR